MSQVIFDKLQPDQMTQTNLISFQDGTFEPSLSGFTLTVYSIHPTHGNLQGSLNLAKFTNLKKITFAYDFTLGKLEEIDISENTKLNMVVLAREKQLNQVIVTYTKIVIYQNGGARWTETSKLLKKQAVIPVFLIEDKKAEQQAEEIEELKQQIQEKDQQIENLEKHIEKTLTLEQFQDLNGIALPNSELDFENLKQEVKRLKLKDFIPYFKEQKDDFSQLVSNAKNKTKDSLETILDLFLQTQKQLCDKEKENDSFTQGQLQGQLTTCQTLLQTKLSKEELRKLSNQQRELLKLEQQWVSLQVNHEKTYVDEY
ncbi:19345_t:CDS:2 [Funneliformis geosporum]|uniref:19345_t:CDS:1 n=1 Tax=Funneliformis geosporum TaxID=1117311 RepID=A0A9W4SHI9_9GLOM|nr:19345_t:CDS:2 [Funneliformis geosporum]